MRALHPFRTLGLLFGGALVVVGTVLGSVAAGYAPDPSLLQRFRIAPADSDSVALDQARLDTLEIDSLAADSLARADTGRVDRYLPRWNARRDRTASRFQRRIRPLSTGLGSYWKHEIYIDSTDGSYVAREFVGDGDVRLPVRMDLETYQRQRLLHDLDLSWRQIAEQRMRQERQRSRGLGFNIVVPGGQQSAFTTIFGKPQVDLRVNGQADIKAGFDYRKSDQQIAFTGKVSQLDPDFKQDLRLGITGRIGDKLAVDVNWDTNNQFDYQNQLKLDYTGYADEIVQSVEAGNVILSTPSRLIRGGQSLFGLKSELQLGGLHITTIASQQEGQANELAITGGSETTEFELRPIQYDDRMHFFLGYYFRNQWERALSQPPNILLANDFVGITDIEVWKLMATSSEDENVRQVVATVDLGEPAELLLQADGYTARDRGALPDNDNDQYTTTEVDQTLRNGQVVPTDFLRNKGLTDADFQRGKFKKLVAGRDYEMDEILGYISLRQRLQDTEALAVSYRYVANGRSYKVGNFSTESGGSSGGQNEDRLVLKLLRPTQLRQPAPDQGFNPAAWYLELRNIYRLQGRSLPPDLELQAYYEPPGKTSSKTIPEVGGTTTLLQMLGLDRLNQDFAEQPDDRFDYITDVTIDAANGLLIFPYLEPFGDRIADLIEQRGGTPAEQQAKKDLYVYESLYRQKKDIADDDTQLDVYRIRGSYKGAVQDFYDLRAYSGLVPGSVVVTSGGSRLTEGTDFIVDYSGGTVQITNPAHLTSGREIKIGYEQNSFFNLQKKTMLGAVAEYSMDERLDLHATMMRLNQKSPIDKFRLGEEPISNVAWGAGGTVDLQPRWLTRAVDALPFIQTKAPSSIRITGEFAQLRPGASQTVAFEQTRRYMRDQGFDFKDDELRGISYIDDFEGFENTFSLKQAGAWRLSAPPDSVGAVDPLPGDPEAHFGSRFDSLRTNWRATMGWYQINRNLLRDLCGSYSQIKNCTADAAAPEIGPVRIQDVYPNRDVSAEIDPTLQTFDLYFNPHERGPYNFTRDLAGFLENPKDAWGGMTTRLPEGYTDFSQKNIEFVEFIVRPFSEADGGDAGPDARLYVDLGSISEDVLPDGQLNTEDGLSLSDADRSSLRGWGRLSRVTQNTIVDVNDETRRTEDLGLDGLASYDTTPYDELLTEANHFRSFLDALDQNRTDPRYRAEVAKALADPSGDDYHYFGDAGYFTNATYYPDGAPLQQWFTRWFPSPELNSFEGQQKFGSANSTEPRGNSRMPDSEDINLNSTVDTQNSYYQYELPLSLAGLRAQADPARVDDYVVTEIEKDGAPTGWFLVRIPVRDYTRKAGQIQDFSLIESMRIWTTGHRAPMTLRFASLELVGSQWKKSTQIPLERETVADTTHNETRLSISSLNNEENGSTYAIPWGTVISQMRTAHGQSQNAREQAMALVVENLMPGKQRAVYRTQSTPLDLLKYENLRMFAHLNGNTADGRPIQDATKVRLFVRLGANETNDFYEYEQPLTPSDPNAGTDANHLWQTNQDVGGRVMDLNSVNIVLDALNQLKVARDNAGARVDSVFWNDVGAVQLNPAIEEFAPPGTRVGIKGTPSLGRINTIVIGVRNAADSTVAGKMMPNRRAEDIIEYASIWVNELRVSGYDESPGEAAMANADIRLADLGQVRASFQWQEDGFGSLASTLGERDQNEILNWSVTTDVNLDKFIPERYGWTIPVSVQIQENTTTPRFSPQRGDIRLDALLRQIEADETLTPEEREIRKQEAFLSAQNHSKMRSFTTRLQKNGSDSPLLRYTLDGLSFNYAMTQNTGRSPTQRTNDAWRWSSALGYRFNIRQPHTVRPFWFLDDVPVIGLLGDLRFNYLPQSLSLNGSAARNFAQTQERPRVLRDTSQVALPDPVQHPIREQHSFGHQRTSALQYNPFPFLNLTYDTNTNQSLNALGVDTLFSVVVIDELGQERRIDNMTFDELVAGDTSITVDNAFQLERLRVTPVDQVFNRLFSNDDRDLLRTDRHEQRFSGTFRPRLETVKPLNWINVQDVIYNVNYRWQNGAVGRSTGANVANQIELRGGLSVRPQEFWRKFGFYRDLEAAQRKAESEAQAARRQREEAKRRQREEEERIDALQGTAADTTGTAPADAPPPPPAEVAEEQEGGFRLPLPSPKSLLRQTILALTGIRDLTVSYNGTFSANSSNVGRPYFNPDGTTGDVDVSYGLIEAFRGKGPAPGYRFGFDRQIPLYDADGNLTRVLDDRLQVTDVLQDGHRIQARTMLTPTQAFQINLTWNADWGVGTNYTYRPIWENGSVASVDTTTTSKGDQRASVWAFGADYLDLVANQLDTYISDYNASDPTQGIGDANADGRVVLTNNAVGQDFRGAFLAGLGTIGARGLMPIPMPGWQVTYSGLSKWPLVRSLVNSASIRHGYTADYSTNYETNIAALSGDALSSFNLGQRQIVFSLPRYEVGGIRVNERFQPLIGVDIGWKGRVQTNVAWNKSNSYSLSSNMEVSQNKASELTVTSSFQKQGLTLPFFGNKRLNNRVSFTLTFSIASLSDQRFSLNRALVEAIDAYENGQEYDVSQALSGDNMTPITASTRLRVSPQVSYQFSNRVSANFAINYENFRSEDSRTPSATTINGGFNIRVSIAN